MNVHASEWTPTFVAAGAGVNTPAAAAAWQLTPSTAAAGTASVSATTSPSMTPGMGAAATEGGVSPPPLSSYGEGPQPQRSTSQTTGLPRSAYPEYYPTFFAGGTAGEEAGGFLLTDEMRATAPDGSSWEETYEKIIALTEKVVAQQEEEEQQHHHHHHHQYGYERGAEARGGASMPVTPNPNGGKGSADATAMGKKQNKKQQQQQPAPPPGPPTWAELLHPSKAKPLAPHNTKTKTTDKKKTSAQTHGAGTTNNKKKGGGAGQSPQREGGVAAVGGEDGVSEKSDNNSALLCDDYDEEEEGNGEYGRFGDWEEQQQQAAAAGGGGSRRQYVPADGKSMPPLTVNGNRRWKKLTKGQRQRELAQKTAFESFAKALLHTTSPFTAPLRQRTKTSLPHIKVDQRFGKPGQPQSAIAQFVVAPLVTNYRPRHFHDVTPGDLLEYHYDFSHVLQALPTAYAIMIGYGPTWKRFAVPYAYVACQNYRQEVLSLCPHEVPNSRGDPIYEEDVLKDITDVVLAVEDLEALQHYSIRTAMRKRVQLSALYDVLDDVFRPLENYQIEIWHLDQKPSTFVLKANRAEVEAHRPLVLHGDPHLWDDLPELSREELKARCTVWQKQTSNGAGAGPSGTAAAGPVATTTGAAAAAAASSSTSGTKTSAGSAALLKKGQTPLTRGSGAAAGSAGTSATTQWLSKRSSYHNEMNSDDDSEDREEEEDRGGERRHDRRSRKEHPNPRHHRRGSSQGGEIGMTVMLVAPLLISVICVAAAVRVVMSMNKAK